MNTKNFWLISVIVAILAIGCAGISGSNGMKKTGITTLAGPVWNLSGFRRESGFMPLEPGHGSSARIIFQKNGKFEGTTGWTVFTGSWNEKKAGTKGLFRASFSPDKPFKSQAPNTTAQQFEEDILQNLRKTASIRVEKSAARFLDAAGQPLLEFLTATGF